MSENRQTIEFQTEVNRSEILESIESKIAEFDKILKVIRRREIILSKIADLSYKENLRVYGSMSLSLGVLDFWSVQYPNGNAMVIVSWKKTLEQFREDLIEHAKDIVIIGTSDLKMFKGIIDSKTDTTSIIRFLDHRIRHSIKALRTLRQQPNREEREKMIKEVHDELDKLNSSETEKESIEVEFSPNQEHFPSHYVVAFFAICFIAYMIFHFVGK